MISKSGKANIIARPIQKVIPFEIYSHIEKKTDETLQNLPIDEKREQNENQDDTAISTGDKDQSKKPRRRAATEGEKKRRLNEMMFESLSNIGGEDVEYTLNFNSNWL